MSDFYISVYEVTQEEYQAVMGENPSNFSGENLPVENVTWYDAVAYCNARSEQEGLMPAYTINGTNVADETGAAGEEATEADTQSDTDGEEQETGTYPDGSTPQFSGERLRFTVNGTDEVVIAMYDNRAVDAFLERLPLEDLSFFDLSGIEKPVERPEEPFSLADEELGYDPLEGEMVIYRPWGNCTIFYGDFRYSDELVPLGKVESGLEVIAGQTDDFFGELENNRIQKEMN